MAAGSQLRLHVGYQLYGEGLGRHEVGLLQPGRRAGPVRRDPDQAARGSAPTAVRPGRRRRPSPERKLNGIHDIEFFLQLDGVAVRAHGIRYLATLVVVGPDERPARYYDELAGAAAQDSADPPR